MEQQQEQHHRRRRAWLAAIASSCLALCACALQPPYQAPKVVEATGWQAELPHGGSVENLVDWWRRFDDPAVAELIRTAEADSPSLAKAVARIDDARATLTSDSSGAWPSLTGSGSVTRAKSSVSFGNEVFTSETTTRSGELDASWELDLFGKVRSARQSSQAQLQARIDDWHDARVSLAAEVADDYVQYRACRQLVSADEESAASYAHTEKATLAAVDAGMTPASDGYLAQANTASANASATQQRVTCEELIKSLVELTGASEAALRAIVDRPQAPALPQPEGFRVQSAPADLVRQRPDLASSERALAAAYASIGKARADRFPSLSLSGSIGLSASNLTTPMSTWSFGPSLSVPLFDAGKRKAAVDSAQASYDEQLASYRSSVRTAVKEVEVALADLDGAARRSDDARRAVEQYRRYDSAMETNWRTGFDTLLTREQARRSLTSAEITDIELQRDRVRNWISLYKALGGGWQGNDAVLPVAGTTATTPATTQGTIQ
ncbi:efflux transporter outer membrane subunit [Trinickia terrae]|uniref:Efflux transporter outer membrane subunit n=1 Tax=Trinickia terrae TaxID=2571161 RepID=A0A4U1I1E4_9BURK|nr:efflux transporter outer membrane subunit [Trinickia terrae]TKC86979.1 efflux transporter outer membrane subunit [Trinickia terrae]